MERYTRPKGYTLTGADTAAHALVAGTGGMVYFTTPATNSGTVTITDADSGGLGGVVLGDGVGITLPVFAFGPILKLEFMTAKFSVAGDVLNYLVLG